MSHALRKGAYPFPCFFTCLQYKPLGKAKTSLSQECNNIPQAEINTLTVFLLINAPRAMQNRDREPLFCTQFAKQKVCPTLCISLCFEDV